MMDQADDRVEAIPHFSLANDALPPKSAVAQRLDTVHLMFDAEPVRPLDEGFTATLRAFKLGPLLFGRAGEQGQCFVRDNQVLARGGNDWLLIQYYMTGGYRGTTSGGPINVRAGDISILDLVLTLHCGSLPANPAAIGEADQIATAIGVRHVRRAATRPAKSLSRPG